MSAITFSGLASGIDSSSLISKLVAAEKSAADPLTTSQNNLTTQKSIINSLSSSMSSLSTAMKNLDLDSEIKPQTATSSDSKISVAVSSNAILGNHDMRVKQLASSQVTASKSFTTNAAGVLGTGSVDIAVAGSTKTVSWDSSDTLDTIANKLNNAGAGVSASVLFDGTNYRLMVGSTQTGTANAATFTDNGDGLDLSNADNQKIAAKDAIVTIDGIDVTRPKNVVDDALPGVTLTLNGVHASTDADSQVAVTTDHSALETKLNALVSAYNAVQANLHNQLDYNGTTKGQDTLFGDSTLTNLQFQLGAIFSNAYGGSNLGSLGLNRDKDGVLSLDTSKLESALSADPNALSSVFVSGGFASTLEKLADNYTDSADGIFQAKTKSLTDQYNNLQDQIDQINQQADDLQTRLEAQFTALETTMSNLKTQSSQLTSFFSSLSSS